MNFPVWTDEFLCMTDMAGADTIDGPNKLVARKWVDSTDGHWLLMGSTDYYTNIAFSI